MALARVTTWNPGDTLTAAAQNAEFNNLLNNPISLISPTTGAINFQTSVAHTNLVVSALTASSGFAGSVLVTSTAVTPVPMWSTGAPAAGAIFIAATSGVPTWLSSTGALFISRLKTRGAGTALTSNNFSISSGWGVGGAATGGFSSALGTDAAYTITVVTGTGVAANPSITTTFQDGIWASVPISVATLSAGLALPATPPTVALTQNTSGQVITTIFTPTSGNSYTFSVVNIG